MKRFIKAPLLLAGAAGLLVAVYFAVPVPTLTGDDLKCARLLADLRWYERYHYLEQTVPSWASEGLSLGRRRYATQNQAASRYRELFRSGYFIETPVVISNFPAGLTSASSRHDELFRRLQRFDREKVFCTCERLSNGLALIYKPADSNLVFEMAQRP
jgi:hypothetical protein